MHNRPPLTALNTDDYQKRLDLLLIDGLPNDSQYFYSDLLEKEKGMYRYLKGNNSKKYV